MQVTQARVQAAKTFGELVGLVFWSIYREGGLDPETKQPIDFRDLPVFSDNELVYSTGDCVLSWDDCWVLAFRQDGTPYVGCRTGKGWVHE